MDWLSAFKIFQVAASIFASVAPSIAAQHWNGTGTDGKLNNAVQILKDVSGVGSMFQEALLSSGAISNAHPQIVAAAGVTDHPNHPDNVAVAGETAAS